MERDLAQAKAVADAGGGDGASAKAAILRLISERGETVVPLVEHVVAIGRSPANQVEIKSDAVADAHARLVREGPLYRFEQLSKEIPTFLHGEPVEQHVLRNGDRLEIAPGAPGAVSLVYEGPQSVLIGDLLAHHGVASGEDLLQDKRWRLDLPANGSLTLGRAPDNDLVLPALSVTLHHARLDLKDGRAVIVDRENSAGLFVNGARVRRRELAVGDVIRIGPHKIVYHRDSIEHHDDSRAVRLDAYEITRDIGKKRILDGISFRALPGEVTAVAGTSGAGKSMLLYTLNGMQPPTHGRVLVNGADLYESFEALQPLLGYVPQREILPPSLPVRRALHYVARLRLPPDVSGEEMDARVDEVIRDLDLWQRRDMALGRLSGGQHKRASIAAELIASPGLFFLDEPTSGLDPGLARRVSVIIRELALANSTVIVISHDVEGIQAADKLVFLATGGRTAFIGSPREALEYFGVDDIAEIYPRVEGEDSALWEQRFKESTHYRERIAPGLVPHAAEESHSHDGVSWDVGAAFADSRRRGGSFWRQLTVMVARYVESMVRDSRNLLLLLAQAPIIALLLMAIAKSTDFQPPPAAAISQAGVFGIPASRLASVLPIMVAATATWFGAINAAREIVKELPIFIRDRLSGLRVLPYLLSKIFVLSLLCVIQTLILLGIIAIRVDLPSSGVFMWGPLEIWLTLLFASLAAMGMGLLISTSMGNPDRAQSIVPILLIPQLIFAVQGTGIASKALSYLTVTRWSQEAMKISSGVPYKSDLSGFGESELLVHWLALWLMATVFLTLAGVQLWRRRSN